MPIALIFSEWDSNWWYVYEDVLEAGRVTGNVYSQGAKY